MAVTISELESERAKILNQIENRAQKLSSDSAQPAENMSLKDWLNAAEEVMPSTAKKAGIKMRNTDKRSNYSSQVLKNNRGNKAGFFGVIIMLTLLLTLLGVLYIAYTSIHKELQSVLDTNKKTLEQFTQLQTDMASLQKSIASGGNTEAFISLEDKVFALEAQVTALQQALENTPPKAVASVVDTDTNTLQSSEPLSNVTIDGGSKLVTEAVLDAKLQSYTQQLEQKIDQKLGAILNVISKGTQKFDASNMIQDALPNMATGKQSVTPVKEPAVKVVSQPVINQPLVKLVEHTQKPAEPVAPNAEMPIENFTADVKWIMSEPKLHYTLQLASMEEETALKEIVAKKQLQDVHYIPQTRNGVTNYILIKGSFANRLDAEKLSREIKQETGISPWIRKVRDITARVK